MLELIPCYHGPHSAKSHKLCYQMVSPMEAFKAELLNILKHKYWD